MNAAILGIVGWKNSGKTRMTASLVAELTRRGLRVSTVKHAHHSFDVDHEGTDSWQHREAGAHEVALVSSRRWVIQHQLHDDEAEPCLDDMLARLGPVDIVLVEGFKNDPIPKIEVRRPEARETRRMTELFDTIIAIAGPEAMRAPDAALPGYDAEDVTGLADFIIARFDLTTDRT